MNKGGFRKKENTIRKHLPFLIFLAAVLASALIFDFRTQRTFIFGDGASYYTFLPELRLYRHIYYIRLIKAHYEPRLCR
jgi:hypothetical protein